MINITNETFSLADCYLDCSVCKDTPMDLTNLGVFISGLLLSIAGIIAVVGSQCRQSKCSDISISKCIKIKRDNIV
tara:strand:- start:338 stop:565 length:228 start_codon:yes stop_codon:yes gene_type:complete